MMERGDKTSWREACKPWRSAQNATDATTSYDVPSGAAAKEHATPASTLRARNARCHGLWRWRALAFLGCRE